MRIAEILAEKYQGTIEVVTDYGDKLAVELFLNPSKLEMSRLMRASEYASVRLSLYPLSDTLYAWVGDNVQHHDMDHALFGGGSRDFIRMFYDPTGVSMHDVPDEEAQAEDEQTVRDSAAVKRAVGRDFEINYP